MVVHVDGGADVGVAMVLAVRIAVYSECELFRLQPSACQPSSHLLQALEVLLVMKQARLGQASYCLIRKRACCGADVCVEWVSDGMDCRMWWKEQRPN